MCSDAHNVGECLPTPSSDGSCSADSDSAGYSTDSGSDSDSDSDSVGCSTDSDSDSAGYITTSLIVTVFFCTAASALLCSSAQIAFTASLSAFAAPS